MLISLHIPHLCLLCFIFLILHSPISTSLYNPTIPPQQIPPSHFDPTPLFFPFPTFISPSDNHIWCATSGVVPDARTLIDHARVETQTHWFNYDEPITTTVCASAIGKLMSSFGTGKMSRPYGVGMLIAGLDLEKSSDPEKQNKDRAQLYYIDPSGTKTRFKAKAIGAGQESAQLQLKEQYHDDMTLEEAKALALDTLKQVISEKITDFNVEVALIPVA